jgi:trk system potassium uptake protein TrkH
MAVNLRSSPGQRQDEIPAIPGDSFGRELANWLFPLYLGAILAGMLAIKWWGMPTGAGNSVRAMFAAINAATLTGFRQSPGLGGLSPFGQSVVLLLIILGSLFNMIVGGLAVRRIASLRFSDLQIIRASIIAEIIAVILGSAFLADSTRTAPHSAFLAASAFGNCALFLGNLPEFTSPQIYFVVLPLSVLGGLGIPVLMELIALFFRKTPLSIHSNIVLTTSALLFLVGFTSLFVLNFAAHHSSAAQLTQLDLQSGFLSIQSRTGGLPVVPLSEITPASQWIIIALMIVGTSPAGTGGGLKTTTLAELFRGARRLLRGQSAGRSLGIALAWLGIYLLMLAGAAILLSHVDFAAGADTIFFNSASALGNVGFCAAELPDESRLMYAYSAIMLLGRMAPLLVLWWMADTTKNADAAIG